jgi:hypothetical protein
VHIWLAAMYAGDWVFNPAGMSKPPPALASGKFGTPWERMHAAYATAPESLLERVVLRAVPEAPQAAIASAQPTATVPNRERAWQRAERVPRPRPDAPSIRFTTLFYRAVSYIDVTLELR